MNKYLKILMLSGGVVGAIAPTAFKVGPDTNRDISNIYENVEKIQNIIPKMSKINYKLDIDATTDKNVQFISTDDDGNETELSQEETITYLDSTLQQTNIEYEQLKTTLHKAIQDTMHYLDKYKNGETELTNEQKLYIKEHSNSIKYLAETLEDLSEEVICAIDGCEECDYDDMTGKYITAINDLEARIQALQHSLNSLQLISNITNPLFYAGYSYTPNHIVYGLRFAKPTDDAKQDLNDNENNTIQNEQANIDNDETDLGKDTINNTDTQEDKEDEITEVEESTSTDNNENTENSKPTTFGLKSNIDTYAPTRRNIDTFFNTALYNNEYGYGGGYNVPYGYGGGYGYGMPYGMGYGNPYGMSGYNSNLINREMLKKGSNNTPVNATLNTSTDNETDVIQESSTRKKLHAKRAKNIDTYTGVTVQSNINSMGESKISNFLKEKFHKVRNKVRKQKDDIQSNDLQEEIQDKIVDNTIIEQANSDTIDTYKDETNIDVNLTETNTVNENIESNSNILEQENQINAK